MGTTLDDLFQAAAQAGFEVLRTDLPDAYAVRNEKGHTVAVIYVPAFAWFTPTR